MHEKLKEMSLDNLSERFRSVKGTVYLNRRYDALRHTYTVGTAKQTRHIAAVFCLIFAVATLVCFTPLWIELAKGRSPVKTHLQYLQELRTQLNSQTQNWKKEIYELNMQKGMQPPISVIERSARGHIMQEIIARMSSLKNATLRQLKETHEYTELLQSVVKDICPLLTVCSQEQMSSPYRTFDGSCNNERNTQWGMAGRQHKRHLPARYRDGFASPRTHGVLGDPLPSPRHVSNVIHRSPTSKREDDVTTVMVMAFGQFLSHDIASTPFTDGHHSSVLKCCDGKSSYPFNACFPVQLADNDTYFRGTKCMSFTRSAPAVCSNCEICEREQINEMTSYIDASQVYGASESEGRKLRNHNHGLLLDTGVDYLLPQQTNTSCRLTGHDQYCFNAGDKRVNVVPNLSTLHTVFVRLHNHFAVSLLGYNPHWDDEKLYQEARRILIAVMQNIVYGEYLSVILGHFILYKYELSVSSAYAAVYRDDADATVSNVFSTAAFRFGHANIPDEQMSLDTEYKPECVSRIEDNYHNPNLTFRFCDGLTRWMVHKYGAASDGLFSDGVRNKLFLDIHNVSFDLVALNIQRGRDHGLPSYNSWRRFCQLPPITSEQFSKHGTSMADFTTQTADLFRSIYRHQEDIDIFSGGVTETVIQDAQVGPTFACILGTDFKNIKFGDRHYFENPNVVSGFTRDQLFTIKQLSFAKILCKMMNIPKIQPSVFRPPSQQTNKLVRCDDLADIDLKYWKSSVISRTEL